MTTKICYNYAPDATNVGGEWEGPNTITFKTIEGEYTESVTCPFDPQIMLGSAQVYAAVGSTSPDGSIDGWKAGQLLWQIAANAFQPDQWPTGLIVWAAEDSELQIQVDGTKVATVDLETGAVTPVEQPTN